MEKLRTKAKPKAASAGKIISILLMVFILSIILPACASQRIYSSSDESRRSLMLGEGVDRTKGKKVRTAKASRSYKKSKRRGNKFKKKKHKYKKRRGKSRRRY